MAASLEEFFHKVVTVKICPDNYSYYPFTRSKLQVSYKNKSLLSLSIPNSLLEEETKDWLKSYIYRYSNKEIFIKCFL